MEQGAIGLCWGQMGDLDRAIAGDSETVVGQVRPGWWVGLRVLGRLLLDVEGETAFGPLC